ncbi:GNAT family N-acetyltransferase [Aquipuribacter hungaricus]|uniref:GNAT family N-acetyltransferase n=1 Tax=Aquipuribacter hungaricus TaxID=545624 RepID=A0ABV7WC07_9MICO
MSGPGTRATLVGRSWREAVATSGRDPVVSQHLSPAAVRQVHAGQGWWAVRFAATPYFEHGGLLVGGDVDRVGEVVEELCAVLRPAEVTVDARVPLPFASPDGGSRWAWRHTVRQLPAVPGEDRVVWDPPTGALEELLAAANPDAFVRPGTPGVLVWAAVADSDGSLLACGAAKPHTPGVPHLSSIAVHPQARRQGLGAAVTVALVRRLLRSHPTVSLALWAGNSGARALYDGLGFVGGPDHATRELG